MSFWDFLKPGWKHPDPQERIRSVRRMKSKIVLMDVYEHDDVAAVRAAVASRLNDQELLTVIAENDKVYSVRKAAYMQLAQNNLNKLTNQTYIADVAKKDKDPEIRKRAVIKLTNRVLLADLAKNAKDYSVRKIAVKKLTDQALLVDVAKNDPDYSVRKAAYLRITNNDLNQLTNTSFLMDIVENGGDSNVRKSAFSILGLDFVAVEEALYAPLTGLAPGSDIAQELQKQYVVNTGYPLEVETKQTGIKLRLVPPGTFMMGSPAGESERNRNETQHQVTLTKPFYCGTFVVMQGQWKRVMGNIPSHFKSVGDDAPVERVSWKDCQDFLQKLCKLEGVPEGTYRLLTEAQWEYACRAGTRTAFCYGDSLNSSQANFNGNYPYNSSKGIYREKTTRDWKFQAQCFWLV